LKRDRAVVVTGAGGVLGRAVLGAVRAWQPEARVVALDLRPPPDFGAPLAGSARQPPVQWLAVDLADPAAVEALAGRIGPLGWVLHLAGSYRAPAARRAAAFVRANTLSTVHALSLAARSPGARVVLASSAAIYGHAAPPVREDVPLRPVSEYGLSKLQAEQWLWQVGAQAEVGCVSARLTNLVGPGQRSLLAAELALRLVSGERPARLHGTGAERRDLIAVDEAARLLVALAQRGVPGQAYNVGTGVPRTVATVAATVTDALGLAADCVRFAGERPAGRVTDFWPDLTRLRDLGLHPRDTALQACRALATEIAQAKGKEHHEG